MVSREKMRLDVKWATRQRLQYIEIMAFYTGVVSRSDVARAFGISDPAATKDLKLYSDLAPGNLIYTQSVFGFVPGPDFSAAFAVKIMDKISVIIITFNEEKNIEECLLSVNWADEIIFIDSKSTDNTVNLAKKYADKIIFTENTPYGLKRNIVINNASSEWIFWLDADERINKELAYEIKSEIGKNNFEVYYIKRKSFFINKFIKHCGWYPDYRQPQLFRKGRFRYREELVHESFDCDGPVRHLMNPAIQYPFRNIDHYISKQDRYSNLMVFSPKIPICSNSFFCIFETQLM